MAWHCRFGLIAMPQTYSASALPRFLRASRLCVPGADAQTLRFDHRDYLQLEFCINHTLKFLDYARFMLFWFNYLLGCLLL